MQALTQLTTTMTPEEWDYIPKREFLVEKFKAHDILIPLLSEEEVKKLRDARDQSAQNQLALKMADAEVGYKKAQTMAQLTKAKKANTDATIAAQTPIEQPTGIDPRLQDAELRGKQVENVGKVQDIQHKDEQHQLDLQHQDESHQMDMTNQGTKTAVDAGIKTAQAEHGMQMKEKMTQAMAKQKKSAPKEKPIAKKATKVGK